MTLAFCKIFHNIAQQQSFRGAAEILLMTPSAVSHAVADAEKRIGFKLFNRTKDGVTLTEYGASLYPSILQLLNGEEFLHQSIDQLNGLERGIVKIGVFNSVCTNWLPDIILRFRSLYPGIQLQIYEGSYQDVVYWIKSGIADFGFLSASSASELPFETLYQDPLVCIVPKTFRTKRPGYITIDEMKDQRIVIQQKGSDADVQALFRKYGLQFQSNCHVLDDTSIIAMVACGNGISVMPTLTARGLVNELQILHICPDEFRVIGLSSLDRGMLSPAAAELYQYIFKYVKALSH